jgi:hypothetical protein
MTVKQLLYPIIKSAMSYPLERGCSARRAFSPLKPPHKLFSLGNFSFEGTKKRFLKSVVNIGSFF